MIEFIDSFSQAAVAEAMCVHPGLAKLIAQQLMLPGFAYAHDIEGRRIGNHWSRPIRCCTRPCSLSVHVTCVSTCHERLTSPAFVAPVMQRVNRSASGNV
ncbi:hypothetical protein [Aeromonas veronii]|uniref:hypothetical protein n=1 Tax=Aeromonas veronii TaxID=654 RepID=UPI0027DB7A00|nr:hypothetical protein [Aeromonas veronii]WMJ04407.1 hypothetical protein RBH93_17700 [Aeromonas veronii]